MKNVVFQIIFICSIGIITILSIVYEAKWLGIETVILTTNRVHVFGDSHTNKIVYVSDVSELRATKPQVNIKYYLTKPNLEGEFHYEPSDLTSPDDSVIVIVSKTGSRIKRLTNGKVHVKWFGASTKSNDNRSSIQKAIDVAFKTGNTAVELDSGIYECSSRKFHKYTCLLVLKSNLLFFGKNTTTIKAKDGSFVDNKTVNNRLIINESSDIQNVYDNKIALKNFRVDCNPSGQTSNAINGIYLEKVSSLELDNIVVLNSVGTGSVTSDQFTETFAISLRLCNDAKVTNCKAIANAEVNSSAGIGDIRCNTIKYNNCMVLGFKGNGFTTFYSKEINYQNCKSKYCLGNSFNQEQGNNIKYFNCKAEMNLEGVSDNTINKQLLSYNTNLKNGSPFKRSGPNGFYMLNNKGGNGIQLIKCVAKNFSSSNGKSSGIVIRGLPKSSRLKQLNENIVYVEDSIFSINMLGRTMRINQSNFFKISEYLTPTSVRIENTVDLKNVEQGDIVQIYGATIDIQECDIQESDNKLIFQEDRGMQAISKTTVNVKNVKTPLLEN